MAETTWTEEGALPPKKKGIPTWAWFCGGGCLLAVLVAVVGIGLLIPIAKKAFDPEAQWERLAHMLPYDERPAELKPMMGFGMSLGASIEQVQLQDTRGFMITIQSHTGHNGADARQKMFKADKPEFPKDVGVMKFENIETSAIEVQGRELRALRMRMEFPAWMKSLMPKKAQGDLGKMGSMAFIDATPEGNDGLVLVEMIRGTGPEPITDDEVRAFLKPFLVGPKHETKR
jgi:hypothetical protein